MIGRLAFAAVFALLIVWLIVIPRDRIGQEERVPPWWRNVRVWAIAIAASQIAVYLCWG
ncbi:MAG: hypothetical protein GXX96_20310 [Planctomycetaceae bacterium]|nr:hypothetical protein [Planctomycetaceae bacterium]